MPGSLQLAGLLLLLAVAGSTAAEAAGSRGEGWVRTEPLLSKTPPPGKSCAPTWAIPTGGLQLSAEEAALLDYLCWPPAGEPEGGLAELRARRGFPPGVTCTPVTW